MLSVSGLLYVLQNLVRHLNVLKYLHNLFDNETNTYLTQDLEYDWRSKDPVLNPNWIPLITDFNTFTYLDSAVELSPREIALFYGHYYMVITNWTEVCVIIYS